MASATVIKPADGAENNAAPHTELTSANVPINSATYFRVLPFIAFSPLPRATCASQDDSRTNRGDQPDPATCGAFDLAPADGERTGTQRSTAIPRGRARYLGNA
jgi:hypothetical protein